MIRLCRRTPLTLLVTALLAACQAPARPAGAPAAPAVPATPAASPDAEVPFFPTTSRPDVRGTQGAVSAGHPLAAQAGLKVLQEGGNAVDAALAMAGVLAVVRPHMNGVGGDAFIMVYEAATGEVHALNGSGRAGALATPAFFRDQGLTEVPSTGPLSVSVPGAVAAWVDIHERFGTRPFAALLEPAIGYARNGFPVSWRLASDFADQGGSLNGPGRAQYLPGNGAPPPVGSLLRNPALAVTLEGIATKGKAGFYEGPVAERLSDFLSSQGSHLRASDFATHTSTWVDPVRTSYLGHEILAFPPNTQGPTQIQMFELAKSFGLKEMGLNTSPYFHTLVEIKKLAFADRDRWMADPEKADIPLDRLLDPAYLAQRARLVDPAHAARSFQPGLGGGGGASGDRDDRGDTVYLTAVDQWGNAVSWIQSLFAGFGSGLFEPQTGVMIHNRGSLYTLEDGHPNQVAPGKRPFHTLSPLLALRDGDFSFTLGTPGGDSQPQSLLQIVNNLLMFGMTPQEAIEAPRFRSNNGLSLSIEHRVPRSVRDGLAGMGHSVRVVDGWTATFGGAQMIYREPGFRTLTVGSDPRREAYGLAW
jgi:gamma-glutamyltranspeptidase/glutathione hydrolase